MVEDDILMHISYFVFMSDPQLRLHHCWPWRGFSTTGSVAGENVLHDTFTWVEIQLCLHSILLSSAKTSEKTSETNWGAAHLVNSVFFFSFSSKTLCNFCFETCWIKFACYWRWVISSPVHPKGGGWASGQGSVLVSQVLLHQKNPPFLYGPGFVHRDTVMLKQEKAKHKMLPKSWKNIIV